MRCIVLFAILSILFSCSSSLDQKNLIHNQIDFNSSELAYDSLLCTVTRKTICKSCLVEDYKLWLQYYSKIDDDPNDIDVIIDDLN